MTSRASSLVAWEAVGERTHETPPAIALVRDLDGPQHAVGMRVLDLDGREVHSASRGGVK